MQHNTTKQSVTHDVRCLEDVLNALDQFHTQVSEDGLIFRSIAERHQLVTLLQEIAYTVDETVHELDRVTPLSEFRLHVVAKPSA